MEILRGNETVMVEGVSFSEAQRITSVFVCGKCLGNLKIKLIDKQIQNYRIFCDKDGDSPGLTTRFWVEQRRLIKSLEDAHKENHYKNKTRGELLNMMGYKDET